MHIRFACSLGLIATTLLAAPTPALADPRGVFEGGYIDQDDRGCSASVKYPKSEYDRQRDGWVDLRFTVKADGSVANIETVSQLGPDVFVDQSVRWLRNCKFRPLTENGTPVEVQNIVQRFHFRANESGAKKAVRTRLLDVNAMIKQGKADEADAALDEIEPDVTTIYERVHILLRRASVMVLRGRTDIALLYLWQLSSSNHFLEPEEYGRFLRLQLQLELKHGLLNNALWTLPHFKDLGKQPGDDKLLEALDKLKAIAASPQPMVIAGRIPAECGSMTCLTTEPSWDYFPVRRTISLTGIDGNLKEIVGFCSNKTFRLKAQADVTWTIPTSWGQCAIQVTGEPGSTFRLIDENM